MMGIARFLLDSVQVRVLTLTSRSNVLPPFFRVDGSALRLLPKQPVLHASTRR